jgi:hypothetical protein
MYCGIASAQFAGIQRGQQEESLMILLPDYLNKNSIFYSEESLQHKFWNSFMKSLFIKSGI